MLLHNSSSRISNASDGSCCRIDMRGYLSVISDCRNIIWICILTGMYIHAVITKSRVGFSGLVFKVLFISQYTFWKVLVDFPWQTANSNNHKTVIPHYYDLTRVPWIHECSCLHKSCPRELCLLFECLHLTSKCCRD